MGGVSKCSKLSRSVVKPALHEIEQIGGGTGCRACGGIGGIAAGWTCTGGGKGVAQPVSSSGSSSSVA